MYLLDGLILAIIIVFEFPPRESCRYIRVSVNDLGASTTIQDSKLNMPHAWYHIEILSFKKIFYLKQKC